VWIYFYQHTIRKYTTQREIISKIDLTGFSLRHLGMVVTIVTIISLTPVIFALLDIQSVPMANWTEITGKRHI
jgi:hypothetical protein